MKKIRLYDIARCRIRGEGEQDSLFLVPNDQSDYLILREYVTAEAVKAHLKGLIEGDVTRRERDDLCALAFSFEQAPAAALGGEGFGTALLDMTIEVAEIAWREEFWPTRDRVGLRTVIYWPETDRASVPCIVQRTPYSALVDSQFARWEAQHYCRLGFAYIIQCCRGTGGSEGEWRPYVHERADGQDLLAHLEKESWCAAIALVGNSYMSFNGWLLGDCLTPKVRTAFLTNFGLDRHFSAYSNGLFRHDILTGWSRDNAGFPARGSYEESCRHFPMITTDTEVWGGEVPWYRDYISHPTRSDAYWEQGLWAEVCALGGKVRFPSLCFVEGWFDHHLGSALHTYEWLTDAQKRHTRLVVGPWNHGFETAVPGKAIPDAGSVNLASMMEDWLVRTMLKGEQPEGDIRFYEIGTGKWRSLPGYPIQSEVRTLHFALSGDGQKILTERPGEGWLSFSYDPRSPVPTCGGEAMLTTGEQRGSLRQPERDYRGDVKTFVSAPIQDGLSIVGQIAVRLRVASTARDTAFCVKVCEEKADGSAWNLRTMITSLAYREGDDRRVPYTPGEFVTLELRGWDICWNLEKGSCLRLDVTSSDFPQYAAHPNRDELWCMTADPLTAEQTLDIGGCSVRIPVQGN